MDGWLSGVGAVTAWLVVVTACAAVGGGLVAAWSRYGHHVPLPGRAAPLVARVLGAPASARSDASSGLVIMEGLHAEPDPVVTTLAAAPTPAAPEAPPPAEPAPPPAGVAPRRIARGDALEELSAVLALTYEQAVAFLEAGLWGLDNVEEWLLTARQGGAPQGVDAEVLARVLALPAAGLGAKRDEFRSRRDALRGLEALWGVGPAEAKALFDAGFRDATAIRKASTDKLAKVPGIGASRAFQIRAAAYGLAPTP